MIENVTVHVRDVLDPETKRVLKKFVHVSMTKLRGKIRSAFTRTVWIQSNRPYEDNDSDDSEGKGYNKFKKVRKGEGYCLR